MSAKAFAPEIVVRSWEERREQDRLQHSIVNIRRNKLLAITVVLICMLSSAALAFWLPSYWRAEIELMPVSRTSATGLGSIAAGLGGMLGGAGLSALLAAPSSTEDEALAVLRSRELFDGYAMRMNLLPELYPGKWDAAARSWTVAASEVPTLRQAYRLFDRQIREIDLDRRSGIVTLGITWKDRRLAVQWARDFVDLTNQQLREQAITQAKANMNYLTQEMRNVRDVSAQTALIAALASAYERQLQEYVFAQGQKDFAFRIIDPPTLPDIRERVSPQRTLIIAIGTLAGLMLAFAAVYIREFCRRRPPPVRLQPELRP
jgi:hypothetical protein